MFMMAQIPFAAVSTSLKWGISRRIAQASSNAELSELEVHLIQANQRMGRLTVKPAYRGTSARATVDLCQEAKVVVWHSL